MPAQVQVLGDLHNRAVGAPFTLAAPWQVEVSQPETVQDLVGHANRARSTGSTGVNEDSSRSHSIMQFALKRRGESDGHPLGKISFIDLAGSERGADTYDNNRCSPHTLFRCHWSPKISRRAEPSAVCVMWRGRDNHAG
jgi:hypothetical protein